MSAAAASVVGAVVEPSLAKTSTYRERSPEDVARGDPPIGGPPFGAGTGATALGEPS
jgi:hypothetical protein